MRVHIRQATSHHLSAIWKATLGTVWRDVPRDERRFSNRGDFEREFRSRVRSIIEGKSATIMVAEDDSGRLLGYVVFAPAKSMMSPAPYGFIYDVWVAPAVRRHGVGSKLLAAAEDNIRKLGLRKMKLEVRAANTGARRLYASRGFEPERIFMSKRLR